MKHLITKVVLFLLLGAIVNVAVAWSSALWADAMALKYVSATKKGHTAVDHPRWTVSIIQGSSSTHVISNATRKLPGRSGPLPHNATKEEIDAWIDGQAIRVPKDIVKVPYWSRTRSPPMESDYQAIGLWEEARGWPMRSLVWHYSRQPSNGIEIKRWSFALSGTQGPVGLPRALPLRPIPLGFFINSLIYALCLWMLVSAPRDLRRYFRNKRGQCLKCGYDMRGSTVDSKVCPECGDGASED